MNRRTYITVLALIALTIAVVLAGCAAAPGGTPTPAATASSATVTPPTIKVLAPLDGAEVPAGEVAVRVETTGLKFVMPSNTVVPGEGHVHFTLDDRPFEMSTTPDCALKDVAAGPHSLKAELVQNDTKSFDPPVVQTVAFIVK